MLPKILNERLCNVQLFPRVWILKILRKAFRIFLSVSGSLWKLFLDIRIRLHTSYPAGYPIGSLINAGLPDASQGIWEMCVQFMANFRKYYLKNGNVKPTYIFDTSCFFGFHIFQYLSFWKIQNCENIYFNETKNVYSAGKINVLLRSGVHNLRSFANKLKYSRLHVVGAVHYQKLFVCCMRILSRKTTKRTNRRVEGSRVGSMCGSRIEAIRVTEPSQKWHCSGSHSTALLLMNMAPAPGTEFFVFVSVAPALEPSIFNTWLRLQVRLLFVCTHWYFQLSGCASNWMGNEIYQKTKEYAKLVSSWIWKFL